MISRDADLGMTGAPEQTDLLFPQPSPLELMILTELEEHVGLEHAIGRQALADKLGIDTRMLEEQIKHLVEEHREPIGSAVGKQHGYFIIKTAGDQKAAYGHINSRIISLAKRKARIVGNTPADVLEEITKQLRLELAQEAISA